MIMKTIKLTIPKELEYVLSTQKDKRVRDRTIKIYNALIYKRGDKKGFFDVPSKYLESINTRYYKAIKVLVENGIIDFKKEITYEYNTLFDTIKRERKIYNADKGICMKYKFLINTMVGEEIDFNINVNNLYKNKRWFNLTKKSLIELGLEPRISRDNFSRRLHTNVTGSLSLKTGDGGEINSYKDYCKGYYTIDGVTSQPRLLWMLMKEKEISDKNLDYIFDNDLDFYDYLQKNIPNILDRDTAKDAFGEWINGKGYMNEDYEKIKTLFPVVTMMMRNFKSNSYKDICKLLQYKESSIWINDLLENCPTDFALSVHDSLIVKEEDVDKVLLYCKNKYPNLKFKKEIIK